MKIIAFYLPQFHETAENNEWWGKGFTEWVNVKKAKKMFKNHYQPRIPINSNYYDLSTTKEMIKQASIAKENGIYGFCYYHYWFEGKKILETPIENMLKDKNVNIPFCLSWANENWTNSWVSKSKKMLLKQTYGNETDWEKHFYYLLEFFKDERYIYENERPLFVIYRPYNIKCCREMLEFWQKLAKNNGLKGISFAYQDRKFNHQTDKFGDLFDYGIEYQPQRVIDDEQKTLPISFNRLCNKIVNRLPFLQFESTIMKISYDNLWKRIIKSKPIDEKMIPGAFVDWDNTPRYENRGSVCIDVTPEKFKYYLSLQIKHAKKEYATDLMFMFAWNEWGEGGYLEPDEKFGYKMLESVKEALKGND